MRSTMDAIRCLDCGDVRWSLIGFRGAPGTCAICGGDMVPERRRPTGRFQRTLDVERRDLVTAEHAAVTTTFHPAA